MKTCPFEEYLYHNNIMKLVTETLQKYRPVKERLRSYGFIEKEGVLTFRKELIDSFTAVISVQDSHTDGVVIDTETGEPYVPLEHGKGRYVSHVRALFTDLLEEIRDACYEPVPFASEQACRLALWVKKQWQEEPDFPFEDDEDDGVFRRRDSRKWYAIVMRIDSRHISSDRESHPISIMNVKVTPEDRDRLLQKDGFYPAYHMNHEHWITICLDDAVDDETIEQLLDVSRQLVQGKSFIRHGSQAWIIPANPKMFDIVGYFRMVNVSSWRQYPSIRQGDTVYIYVGVPFQAIMYRCVVKKTDVPDEEEHPHMIMDIVERYDPSLCQRHGMMARYGVTNVRGPRRMPEGLEKELRASCSKE
jgi:predicted DNA-binding protein (MmcQ/YjbR family)